MVLIEEIFEEPEPAAPAAPAVASVRAEKIEHDKFEADASKTTTNDKTEPNEHATRTEPNERTRAFLRSLDVDEETVERLMQGGVSDEALEKLAKGAAGLSDLETSGVVSCIREGWWYESGEKAEAHAAFGLQRLQGVAKASGDSAAKAADWEGALEHYFSAMEVSWKLVPGGGDELGKLHSNSSLCCLKLGREVEAL